MRTNFLNTLALALAALPAAFVDAAPSTSPANALLEKRAPTCNGRTKFKFFGVNEVI